jgi:hypothetical protein
MKKILRPLRLLRFFKLPRLTFQLPTALRWLRVFRFLKILTIPVGLLLAVSGAVGIAVVMYGMALPLAVGLNMPQITNAVRLMLGTPIEGLIGSSVVAVLGLVLLRRLLIGLLVATFWWIVRFPKALWQSPLKTYRSVIRGRDWLLALVASLQAESQKWATLFTIVRSPYKLLLGMGLSPSAAVTLLIGASTVGTGVIVNETILEGRSFRNGDAGTYLAPGDAPVSYVTDPEEVGYNTLRVDLGSTPVSEINISNISLGTTGSALPSGQQNVIEIGGNAASSGFNATRLLIGELIFEKNQCRSLELSDIQTHSLTISGNSSDGQSIAPTAASGAANRRFAIMGGHHQAEAMSHSGGLFDRLWLSSNTSGVNGAVDRLVLRNISSKGGPCKLSRINASSISILLNTIGHDSNLSTKEFVVATNVTASVISVTDNIEMNVTEPATQ